jgi:hypothetical protein
MTLTINGMVFSVYSVCGQWKVVHPTRANGRIGQSVVRNVDGIEAGVIYAHEYANTSP